ncbi:MAG: TetR/AcrR family transcriptional regulator [Thermodesulfobacteriota bacterium]|nr:TetR/AcrR family transcriptional regulator [Thermodesulfobacteriota bacterium]
MGIKERREREKAARRKQIQDAARQVFMNKGFYSATMEDIANKLELSPTTIYKYFKNKEELFASLMIYPLKYLLEHTKKVHDDDRLSVEDKMRGVKEVMYQTFQYDPLMLRNIFYFQLENTLSNISPELQREINDTTRQVMNLIAGIYEGGVKRSVFVPANGMACADIFWSMFAGLVVYEGAKKKLNPKKDFLEPTFETAFEFLLRGIKA